MESQRESTGEPKSIKTPLERAEGALYTPEEQDAYEPQKLSPQTFEAPETWRDNTRAHREETLPNVSIDEKTVKKIFVGSLLFFVLAAGFAAYRLFLGPILSPDNVNMTIEAPRAFAGGEEQTLSITVKNNNRSDIESTELDIIIPDGITIQSDHTVKDRRISVNLGPLLSGASRTEEITFTAFGEEDEAKQINIELGYRMKGSSAVFSQEEEYSFVLSTAPLTLTFVAPEEVNANEEFTFTIEAVSKAPELLTNVALTLSYPPGFSVVSQNPKANRSNNMWVIGDMKPSDTYKLTLRGKISGHAEDQKTFNLSIGQAEEGNTATLSTVYNQNAKTITIREAFVAVDFLCDGDKNTEVAISDNKEVVCEIQWKNNFATNVTNGSFRVGIAGSVIDRQSIKVFDGFYKSDESAIIWNQTTDNNLAIISPKDSGNYKFSFRTVPLLAGGGTFQNPEIQFSLRFTGDRIATGQTNEPITITLSKKVRVNSALSVQSYGLYYTGRFNNTGPLPPVVDQKTTYTIVWQLTNSSNDVRNTLVTASLPIYSEWLGTVSPLNEDIKYNATTGTVSWNVGTLPAGTGVNRSPREVMFQIGFVPSVSQKRTSPTLISAPQLSGIDSFSNEPITAAGSNITTELSTTNDPTFNRAEQSQVVE
jgi:hypothetical protein